MTNPREQKIYETIIQDIEEKGRTFSQLTNQEISQLTGIPLLSVRKKVLSLVKKKILFSLLHQFELNGTYVPRRLYKGSVKLT